MGAVSEEFGREIENFRERKVVEGLTPKKRAAYERQPLGHRQTCQVSNVSGGKPDRSHMLLVLRHRFAGFLRQGEQQEHHRKCDVRNRELIRDLLQEIVERPRKIHDAIR